MCLEHSRNIDIFHTDIDPGFTISTEMNLIWPCSGQHRCNSRSIIEQSTIVIPCSNTNQSQWYRMDNSEYQKFGWCKCDGFDNLFGLKWVCAAIFSPKHPASIGSVGTGHFLCQYLSGGFLLDLILLPPVLHPHHLDPQASTKYPYLLYYPLQIRQVIQSTPLKPITSPEHPPLTLKAVSLSHMFQ